MRSRTPLRTQPRTRLLTHAAAALATALVPAALLMAAPAAHADDGGYRFFRIGWGGVAGSGKIQTESRAVSGFQAIALSGSMKLVLRQGSREGIELQGDDNILPLIETRVVDRGGVPTLEIGTKRGSSYTTRAPIIATIDLTTLTALTISGSGDVKCDALKTPSLRISVSGSGNIRMQQLTADEVSARVSGSGDIAFSGKAPKLALSISGSGNADTTALESEDVSVSVAGSGDANVNARKTLTVSIAGSGSVAYKGDASVKSSVAGHGSIKKL